MYLNLLLFFNNSMLIHYAIFYFCTSIYSVKFFKEHYKTYNNSYDVLKSKDFVDYIEVSLKVWSYYSI